MALDSHIFTVREVNRYVKTTLERERSLQGMLVRGEVSNCTYHSSGHLYFTIKDEQSQLSCVMWKDRVQQQKFRLESGMRVLVEGSITVYERGGNYQLNAYSLQADGIGNLFLAFEQMKRKLEEEGLFAEERKRPLPYPPRRIALLTSATGAVAHDFLTVSGRRWPGRRIILIPTTMQGAGAPASVVHNLRLAAVLPDVDVIVVARGGGSFEDLACFNDEAIARAIVASPVPVVSAIGHETDFTIADFVADLRAPTPSAAAELVIPDEFALSGHISTLLERVFSRARDNFRRQGKELDRLLAIPALTNPRALLRDRAQTLDLLEERITTRVAARIDAAAARFRQIEGRLEALHPQRVLQRGYALVTRPADGMLLPTASEARTETDLDITFSDGIVHVNTVR
ncbi:MAG: exodeoxyribonuclease VII large subunit [bacterium]